MDSLNHVMEVVPVELWDHHRCLDSPKEWENHKVETPCHFRANYSNSLVRFWKASSPNLEGYRKESHYIAPIRVEEEHVSHVFIHQECYDDIGTNENRENTFDGVHVQGAPIFQGAF